MIEEKRYCCTCEWYAQDVGVCCCTESEWTADFRSLDDSCPEWTENRMNREKAYSIMLNYISSVGGCGVEYWTDEDAKKMRECLNVIMFGNMEEKSCEKKN